MARRIDVQWHRNNKALDLVIGDAHITLIPDELALLAKKAEEAYNSPPPDHHHRLPLAEARTKVTRPEVEPKVMRKPPVAPCHRKGPHDNHHWSEHGEKRRCPGRTPR